MNYVFWKCNVKVVIIYRDMYIHIMYRDLNLLQSPTPLLHTISFLLNFVVDKWSQVQLSFIPYLNVFIKYDVSKNCVVKKVALSCVCILSHSPPCKCVIIPFF